MKYLKVVVLAMLILTGAVGLRNIVGANATSLSASNGSVSFAQGGPVPPLPPPGGGH